MLRAMMTARASAAARRGPRPTAAAMRSAAGAATATTIRTAAAMAVTPTRTMPFTSRCSPDARGCSRPTVCAPPAHLAPLWAENTLQSSHMVWLSPSPFKRFTTLNLAS